ncbi:MAG: amidohydrolase [Deltaproteobacteria bacterium]|nr:amidohydrolase [Deltaproteobacteria bacterium]MBW2152725.1 amidohydrolase [Deltaproteobacteria bacterium]
MKWTVANALMMTPVGTVLDNRHITIEGDTIASIENGIEKDNLNAEKVIDATGKLIIPGLINAHLHSHDRFDKGRFDNLPLEIWMAAYNPPTSRREWTEEEVYLRTQLNCIELIKSGTTTVIDDVVHHDLTSRDKIDAVFQAYEDAGLRAAVTITFSDRPYHETIPFLDEFLPGTLKDELQSRQQVKPKMVLELWKSYARRWQGRVTFALSPSGPQRSTDAFLKDVWKMAEDFNLWVMIHVLETKVQEITGYLFYNKSLVDYMKSIGILNRRTNLVHCVWVNDRDIALIAEAGANVIHNPVSNLKLGSGIAPVHKLLKAGVNVALGTDNNNANDTANMFEAMKIGALVNKVTHCKYDRWVGAKEVFKMATKGGSRCIGMEDKVGVLEAGKKADFVLINLDSLPFTPRQNILNQLIFCENGQSIDMVVVDGKIIYENGKILTINEEKLKSDVQQAAERLLAKIEKTSKRASEILPYLRKAYDKCLNLAQVKPIA